MRTTLTIFLAGLVLAANTYCACAAGNLNVLHGVDDRSTTDSSCCRPAGREHPVDCPRDDDHNPHTCSHCNGTVSPDVSKVKMSLSEPGVFPFFFAVAYGNRLLTSTGAYGGGAACDHTGLSPPPRSPSLLDLSCSLNT